MFTILIDGEVDIDICEDCGGELFQRIYSECSIAFEYLCCSCGLEYVAWDVREDG